MLIAVLDICKPRPTYFLKYIQQALDELHISAEIHLFASPDDLMEAKTRHPYQMVFIDLDFPEQAGLKAARMIRLTNPQAIIVYQSVREPLYSEMISVHAFDCLQKPIEYERVIRLFEDIESNILFIHPQVELHYGTKCLRLLLEDIRCVTSAANYCNIQTPTIYHLRIPFQDLIEQLQDSRFLQINRGVLINMDHVAEMTRSGCSLTDGQFFPLNQRRSAEIYQAYQDYMAKRDKWVTL